MKKNLMFFALLFYSTCIFPQYDFRGVVKDQNNEVLAGANVFVENVFYGTTTDANGTFELAFHKKGEYVVKVTYVGYDDWEEKIVMERDEYREIQLKEKNILAEDVVITAIRATDKTPIAYTDIDKSEIRKNYSGQDIPYLLQLTPSLVESSESGTGIGYTSFKIRGTDASRINVTLNGIPLNDAESHGVYWVNLPDLAASIDHVQIQRGVGTSTNGAAAFGATINLQTHNHSSETYAEVSSTVGSFGTYKNTFKLGSGLIQDKFAFEARYSKLLSDGYVDRSGADHEALYVSGAYYSQNFLVKANIIHGEEHTGISWWGCPKDSLPFNRTFNPAGMYTDTDGNITFYNDQKDNYWQTHYQLFFSHQLSQALNANLAFHYTKGKGYYEQYKEDEAFEDYGLDNIQIGGQEINVTDIIRRKWLDNDFYGITYSFNLNKNLWFASLGGSWNIYDGDHFGRVIWMQYAGNSEKGYEWYVNNGKKQDFTVYGKVTYQVSKKLSLFSDLQYRHIDYRMKGIDDDGMDLGQRQAYDFLNPKAGIYYQIAPGQKAYFSFSVANREPTRANFKDARKELNDIPEDERLYDYELGYEWNSYAYSLGVNLYYMNYKDQLVLTGELNNVGYPIMTNVDKSYRRGVELTGGIRFTKNLLWRGNVTWSQNKILNFTEHYVDYLSDGSTNYLSRDLGNTDISYSPNVVGASEITYKYKGLSVAFISKYVGKQYFDNTRNEQRKMDPYFVNNLTFNMLFQPKWVKEIRLQFNVNNLLDYEYENNAYGWYYYSDGQEVNEAYYFPQAGIHFLTTLNVIF